MKGDWIKQIRSFLRTALSLFLNPHYLLCSGIAWMITNGWAYLFVGLGTWFDIGWMLAVGSAYLALIWVPFTPEKIITTALAIGLLRLLFPNDQKTLAILKQLLHSAREKWNARKRRRRKQKDQQTDE